MTRIAVSGAILDFVLIPVAGPVRGRGDRRPSACNVLAADRHGSHGFPGPRAAGLTAAGQTNREIAQRLYITQKTAEGHLARAFRKLRIDSRAPLPAALSRELGCR